MEEMFSRYLGQGFVEDSFVFRDPIYTPGEDGCGMLEVAADITDSYWKDDDFYVSFLTGHRILGQAINVFECMRFGINKEELGSVALTKYDNVRWRSRVNIRDGIPIVLDKEYGRVVLDKEFAKYRFDVADGAFSGVIQAAFNFRSER